MWWQLFLSCICRVGEDLRNQVTVDLVFSGDCAISFSRTAHQTLRSMPAFELSSWKGILLSW